MVMRSRPVVAAGLLAASGLTAVALAIGCAAILSIPDRTLGAAPDGAADGAREWCDQPANKHDFCDDFDHDDAAGGWTPGSTPGATFAIGESSDTPPNAVDMTTTPQPLGVGAVAGLYVQFPMARKFDHVRFAVDVRLVSIDLATEGGLSAELGFLLLEQQDFCIGVVMTQAGIGVIMRSHSTDCTGVTNLPDDSGTITDDAGLTGYALVSPVPNLKQWYHIALDVKRNADGSGALGFDLNFPGVITPPQIPPGYLTEAPPLVAIATSVVGPSGRIEVQFDNATVDFSSN
jgi:hypothetical protein